MSNFVSTNPDDLSQGLADNFAGTINSVVLAPTDYGGKIDNYTLAAIVTIQPDEGEEVEEEVVSIYGCGDLKAFVPSMDGINPAGASVEEYIALAEGESQIEEGEEEKYHGVGCIPISNRKKMSGGTNWAHFMACAVDAGFDKSLIQGDFTVFEGLHAHFDRIPQRKRGNLPGGDGRERTILVPTKIIDMPSGKSKPSSTSKPAKASSKPATKAASKPAATSTSSDGFDESLSEAIVELLAENGAMERVALRKAVMAKFPDNKAAAFQRAGNATFLEASELWTFDAESDTVSVE